MAGLPIKKHLKSITLWGGAGAGVLGTAWTVAFLHFSFHPAGSAVAVSSAFATVVGAAAGSIVAIVKIRAEHSPEKSFDRNVAVTANRIEDPERALELQIAARIADHQNPTDEMVKWGQKITGPTRSGKSAQAPESAYGKPHSLPAAPDPSHSMPQSRSDDQKNGHQINQPPNALSIANRDLIKKTDPEVPPGDPDNPN